MGLQMSEQPKSPPWFKAPLAEIEARLRIVALRLKAPLSRVTWVWLKVQASAQALDRGGLFQLDLAELALLDGVDLDAIERIFHAFEAPDMLLIADGRCTTFKEKEKSRDRKMRERKASERASDAATPRDAKSSTSDAGSPFRVAVGHRVVRVVFDDIRIRRYSSSVVVSSRLCART